MAEQILQQPDGYFSVFSSHTETFIIEDATSEELIDWRVEELGEEAREKTEREIKSITENGPHSVYKQFAMSWGEAAKKNRLNEV